MKKSHKNTIKEEKNTNKNNCQRSMGEEKNPQIKTAIYIKGPGVPDLGMVKIEFHVVSKTGGP